MFQILSFQVKVTTEDGERSTSKTIIIEVQDINDNGPEFEYPVGLFLLFLSVFFFFVLLFFSIFSLRRHASIISALPRTVKHLFIPETTRSCIHRSFSALSNARPFSWNLRVIALGVYDIR